MPPKNKSTDNPEDKSLKRTNVNPTPPVSPDRLSLSPAQSSESVSSNPSVSTASSVSSGSGGMVSLTHQLGNSLGLSEEAKRALRRDHIYPPDADSSVRSVLPGGSRAMTRKEVAAANRQAMLELTSDSEDDMLRRNGIAGGGGGGILGMNHSLRWSSSDESPSPRRGPVTAEGHLTYTGTLLIPDSELDAGVRHRFWGACDNEVRLVLPPSEIMRDMRRQAGILVRLDSSLTCNLTVQEIETAIRESRIVLPEAQGNYRHHLLGLRDLVDRTHIPPPQSDRSTLSLYRLLVANCLPGGVWAERCGVRDTVEVLAPVLGFRDLEFLCSPSAAGMTLQALLDQERYDWLERKVQIYALHREGITHVVEKERFDLHQTRADKDSDAETNSLGSSSSRRRSSSVSGSSVSGMGSGGESIGRFGGKRRKPATKRKASRSASSKRKPTSTKRRRTHNARRRR